MFVVYSIDNGKMVRSIILHPSLAIRLRQRRRGFFFREALGSKGTRGPTVEPALKQARNPLVLCLLNFQNAVLWQITEWKKSRSAKAETRVRL